MESDRVTAGIFRRRTGTNDCSSRQEPLFRSSQTLFREHTIDSDDDQESHQPAAGPSEYSGDPNAASHVHLQIDEVSNRASDTIGKLLNRGEHIDTIKGKAGSAAVLTCLATLEGTTNMFRKTSRKAYNKSWWDKLQRNSFVYLGYFVVFLMIVCESRLAANLL